MNRILYFFMLIVGHWPLMLLVPACYGELYNVQDMSCTEYNKDNEVPSSQEIGTVPATDLLHCLEICKADSNCLNAAFSDSSLTCHLKSGYGTVVGASDVHTVYPRCVDQITIYDEANCLYEGVDLTGQLIDTVYAVPSALVCRDKCLLMPSCVVATYNMGNNDCYRKRGPLAGAVFHLWANGNTPRTSVFRECVTGAWSAWSACHGKCGYGTKIRTNLEDPAQIEAVYCDLEDCPNNLPVMVMGVRKILSLATDAFVNAMSTHTINVQSSETGNDVATQCTLHCYRLRQTFDNQSPCNSFVIQDTSDGSIECKLGYADPTWIAKAQDVDGTVKLYSDVLI